MNTEYYETLSKMEKAGVNQDYVTGWATGYLHTSKKEEQNITDAYEAGYNDGYEKKTDGFSKWVS